MRIINLTKDNILADNVILADSPLKRIVGLLKHKEFNPGQAMIIRPCNQIHTFFMRFSIDVLFLDKANEVIATIPDIKPWHLTPLYFSARITIELPVGTIKSKEISLGDTISLQ